MTFFQRLHNRVLIFIRRKKHYSMHYKMWDYIVAHLLSDSEYMLSDPMYISYLKKRFLEINHYDEKLVFQKCFLCDLYYGTLKASECTECPFYKSCGVSCICDNSPFRTVVNKDNERTARVEAAIIIRDCVLRKGGK